MTCSMLRAALTGSFLAVVLCAPAARSQDPAVVGRWDPLLYIPAVPVHSVLLYTNKIMLFRGDGHDDINHDPASYVLDLETGQITTQDPLGLNVFCVGHSQLPDGRILMTGGTIDGTSTGPNYANIFDPVTELWSPAPDMRDGRYYPTNTPLADGTTLIFSGTNQLDERNPEVERFIIGAGPSGEDVMEYLEDADKSLSEYPRNHLLPDGKIFVAGTRPDCYLFDPASQDWTFVDTSNYGKRNHGCSVMVPPGHTKIMILGGWDPDNPLATNTVEMIDLADNTPAWEYVSPMHHQRIYPNAVILPDMTIFVSGGSLDEDEEFPVYTSELYDPATDTWTEAAVQASYRLYHSSATLLPDGRVLWGGGNGNETMEIYSPPYLFKGPRPTVTMAPASVEYGEPFVVETPDAADITAAVFMRPGATTHSVNMEQRYVGLDFVVGPGEDPDSLVITAPTEGNIAMPGYYMLFLLNSEGVPSEAPFIRLGSEVQLQVSAGFDDMITLPETVSLNGTVVANQPPALQWGKVSGPGQVSFTEPNEADTWASFSESGTYVLSLTADDGSTVMGDDVVIIVNPPGTISATDEHIVAWFDDAEEWPNGTVDLSNSDLELVNDWPGTQTVGLRFNNIEIPPGARVVSAYITFTADETGSQTTNLTIEGDATDMAMPFVDIPFNVSSRPRTAASVQWSPDPWSLIGQQHDTPDLTEIVQELVDRPGWLRGNSMAFIITGSGKRVVESVDGDPAGSAHLHVLYTSIFPNQPPTVFAGHNQVVTLPGTIELDATIGDEEPTAVVSTWSKVSGPGVVTFGDPADQDTTASFALPGTYVLQITADDGEFQPFDQLLVIVNPADPNAPPVVDAGLDLAVDLRTAARLAGSVDDDGTADALSITWSRVSGPGRVAFGDRHAAATTARFFRQGTYVLRLTAQDRQFRVEDEVVVTVKPKPKGLGGGVKGKLK